MLVSWAVASYASEVAHHPSGDAITEEGGFLLWFEGGESFDREVLMPGEGEDGGEKVGADGADFRTFLFKARKEAFDDGFLLFWANDSRAEGE